MIQLGLKLRDHAIDRLSTTHGEFCRAVIDHIRSFSTGHEFTTDDLWRDRAKVSEPRAMGAAIRDAARAGLIESTRKYVPSWRSECHARPILVWRRL